MLSALLTLRLGANYLIIVYKMRNLRSSCWGRPPRADMSQGAVMSALCYLADTDSFTVSLCSPYGRPLPPLGVCKKIVKELLDTNPRLWSSLWPLGSRRAPWVTPSGLFPACEIFPISHCNLVFILQKILNGRILSYFLLISVTKHSYVVVLNVGRLWGEFYFECWWNGRL